MQEARAQFGDDDVEAQQLLHELCQMGVASPT
jgi:hypothetical protein